MYYENKLWILIEYCEGGALDDIIEKIDHGKGLQTIPKKSIRITYRGHTLDRQIGITGSCRDIFLRIPHLRPLALKILGKTL